MEFVRLILDVWPFLLLAAAAGVVAFGNPRQRLAVLLTWAVPGLGHFWLGRRDRGLVFGCVILLLFIAGMAMAGFANVNFERHPVWGLTQIPGGLLTVVAWLTTSGMEVKGDNPVYAVGCLYTAVACLLNVLAMCDVWDLAENPSTAGKGT